MFLADRLTLDAPRRTSDGYLAVRARAARTGVYQYAGAEVDPTNQHGLRDTAIVNVLRDDATVFDTASVHSFIGKPITDDHPKVSVTAKNWRDLSRGTIMGAMRDGDHLAFDLMITDQTAIDKVAAGKRELSNGYEAGLEFGDFKAGDGTVCQARQISIRGNHIALVDAGRAGPSCRIGDAATCDAAPQSFLDSLHTQEKPVKNFMLDGLPVNLGDADTAVATLTTVRDQRDTARTDLATANTTIATKDRELAAKDTEIATLKGKVEDHASLDALADAKADLVTKGKALLGDKMPDVKGKSLADTRRAIVIAATGDQTLKDKSDDYIEARFDGLKDAKSTDTIRDGLSHQSHGIGDVRNLRDAARALN